MSVDDYIVRITKTKIVINIKKISIEIMKWNNRRKNYVYLFIYNINYVNHKKAKVQTKPRKEVIKPAGVGATLLCGVTGDVPKFGVYFCHPI